MKAPIRRKLIEMDGAAIQIASLTFDQVQEILGPQMNAPQGDRYYLILAASLNNAALSDNGEETAEPRWDEKRIKAEMDMLLIDRLFTEVLNFSGLKLTAGESQAVAPAQTTPPAAEAETVQ